MRRVESSVTLLHNTPWPEKCIAAAVRQCYSDSTVPEILAGMSQEEAEAFVRKLVSFGHLSGIEHASFTFYIEGVSRAFTHQLVRHRLASYSQQSQRYVKMNKDMAVVVPETIEGNANAMAKYQKFMGQVAVLYQEMLQDGIPAEDARMVLPNGVETKITLTMNARQLHHFFSHRCCRRAQWEIRGVAWEMLRQCKEVAPVLFENAGPPCMFGPCPEGKMSCGEPYRKE